MKKIAVVCLITILLLSSTQLFLYHVTVSAATDIQPAAIEAGTLRSDSPDSISWHWDCPADDHVDAVAMSDDGSYVVARTFRGKIHLFNKSSSTPVWTYSAGTVFSVDISDNGSYIVAGGSSVLLFNASDNTPIWENDYGVIDSVAISSDGSYIVAAVRFSKVLLFSKENSIPIRTYDIDDPLTVSISADGQYIAVGTWGGDESVYLLDKDSSVPIWSYFVDYDVSDVVISADASHIAARAHSLYLFNSMENTPLWTFIKSKTYGVDSVAISSDGSRIAVGDVNGVYELTNSDNATIWEFVLPRYRALSVAISYDGRYVSGLASDNVYLFREFGLGIPLKYYEVPFYGESLAMSQGGDYIACDDGEGITFREVEFPQAIYTIVAVTPLTFTLGSENSISLKATLTSQGSPLVGKTITWTKTAGSLSVTSGVTDNSGQTTVTYTAPSVETHASVTISASFAGDENYDPSSGNSSGTINPAGPVSALIASEYNGFFLHNVNAITNTYRVVVSQENVSSVVFQMDSDMRTVSAPPYEVTYNMGSVGLDPTLNVTVYLTGGTTLFDSVSPTILETPAMLSHIINFFNGVGEVTVDKANGCWKMRVTGAVSLVKAAMSVGSSVVPFDVGLGDYELPIPTWTLGFTMESDDYNKRIDFASAHLSIDDAEFMGFGGLSFDAELSGGFTVRPNGEDRITTPTIAISTSGHVSWTYEFGPIWLGPVPITVSVTPHFGTDLDMDLGIGNPLTVDSVSGDINGGVRASAGVGIPGASAGAYFDGTAYLYFVAVPSFDFQRVTVSASVGLYAELLWWEGSQELWHGSWSSNPGARGSPRSEVEWKLNERDYLGPGYSTLAWIEGNHEGALVENVYSNPQPSLAVAENGSMVAAWTYDDPSKDFLQALEIAYSTYDYKQGTWSAPATITSDDFLDCNPKLAYIGGGRVLAVWQRVPHQLENTISPFTHIEDIELAYSIFDMNTGQWSAPQLITSNSAYEAPPTLTGYGERAHLVYLKDSDNNLFTLDNQTLVATEWTGASWSVEETIASGITVIGSPRLSLAGTNDGILTFVRDMDDNLSTVTDREIFYLRYDGSWGTPMRLTTDNIWEESPSAGWANNQWYLSWIEMEPTENVLGYTTSVRFGELTNGQLTGSSLLENQGVTEQFILGEIQDNLYMLYQVGAEGTPGLIRYDGSAWENVENFQWSPKVENARTSQLSVSVGGNHLGAVGVTEIQAEGGQTFKSLHASIFSLYPSETPPAEISEIPWVLIGGIIVAAVAIGIISVLIFLRRKRMISDLGHRHR